MAALGVTTAVTMWFMSVVGICFGAGQMALGATGVAIALAVLWLLKWFDIRMPRNLRTHLTIACSPNTIDEAHIRSALLRRSYRIISLSMARDTERPL